MNGHDETPAAADPFELWRQIYQTHEQAWNAALERSMATPEFAESQAKLLETLLNAQKSVRDQSRAYLEVLDLPTREDRARFGKLIVGMKEKVDQLDDRLGRIEVAHQRAEPAPVGLPKTRLGISPPASGAEELT